MSRPSAYEWLGDHKNRAIWCGCEIINEQNAMSGHCGDDYIKFCEAHAKAVPERIIIPPDADKIYREFP